MAAQKKKPTVGKKQAEKSGAKKAVKAKASTPTKLKVAPASKKASKAAAKKIPEKVKAKAALKKVEEEAPSESSEEEEFDPQAFFEASGGKGIFRAHIMRKERVDFNLPVRYRFLDSPLVYNAELLNLSKGGLALRTPKQVKAKTTVRVEIPLPHTSELFTILVECVWSGENPGSSGEEKNFITGFKFNQMSLAKQTVINNFIQQRRDEVVLAKIGLDKFKDSAPVAGID